MGGVRPRTGSGSRGVTGAGGRPATVLAVALGILLAVAVGTPVAAAEVHVLAASWQPAFCETRPAKPECLSQTEDRVDATGFSLHGLWPQPVDNVYCGVPPELRAVDEAQSVVGGKQGADRPGTGRSAVISPLPRSRTR